MLIFFASGASAQRDNSGGVYVGLQGGFGYGSYRDLGASPLTYHGLELLPGLKVGVERPMWRYEADLGLCGGGYGLRAGFASMHAYGGQLKLGFTALRKVWEKERWQLWAGASLDDRADIRYNSVLQNANVGFSNLVNLNLIGRAEMRLGNWVMHGQLAITPASLLLRPGFAYMDNFDHEISSPVADFAKQYRWYVAGMTIVATDLGATFLLKNGNHVGLAYRWHYLTSRATADDQTAPYRFEQANHALVVEMGFSL